MEKSAGLLISMPAEKRISAPAFSGQKFITALIRIRHAIKRCFINDLSFPDQNIVLKRSEWPWGKIRKGKIFWARSS